MIEYKLFNYEYENIKIQILLPLGHITNCGGIKQAKIHFVAWITYGDPHCGWVLPFRPKPLKPKCPNKLIRTDLIMAPELMWSANNVPIDPALNIVNFVHSFTKKYMQNIVDILKGGGRDDLGCDIENHLRRNR